MRALPATAASAEGPVSPLEGLGMEYVQVCLFREFMHVHIKYALHTHELYLVPTKNVMGRSASFK